MTRLPFAVEEATLQSASGELWAVRSRGPHEPWPSVRCQRLLIDYLQGRHLQSRHLLQGRHLHSRHLQGRGLR